MKRIPKSDYYASDKAAALAFGLTKAELGWCKEKGAPGFAGSGRVHDKPLRAWLKKHRDEIPKDLELEDLTTLKKRHLRCRIEAHEFDMERKRFEFDVERKRYVVWENVRSVWTGYVEDLKRLLHDKYETQLPPKQEGLRAPELATMARETNADIINRLRGTEQPPSPRDNGSA